MTGLDSAPIDVSRLQAQAPVAQVEYYETLASTHDVAHERARQADVMLPALIVADAQTAGRGRGQNRWWTGGGSLALSLVFDPENWQLAGPLQPQRSLAAGVAIVDAVTPLLPGHQVGLHWPNDVFTGGRKLAGILVDVLAGGRHVVGIGLNVNNRLDGAPPEVQARATSMCELAGHAFDRTDVLIRLLLALQQAFRASAAVPLAFGERFASLCQQVGRPLTIDVGGTRTTGVCAGISPHGALLLDTSAGRQQFHSGTLIHEL